MNDFAARSFAASEDAPEFAPDLPADSTPAIDLVRLARQCLGDQDLERELLVLFERQAARAIGRLAGAPSGDFKLRADLAHTLKGSALAVGAQRVAEAAARVETLCSEQAGDATLAAALASLAAAVSEAREAIARLAI